MDRPILFIEDDEDDTFIIRSTLEREGIDENSHFVQNGRLAVDYLESCTAGTYGTTPLPRLIFLDINMPLMNGFEFLRWRREQPAVQAIPVLMLTSSDSHQDIADAYRLGANGYLVKPMSVAELSSLLQSVHSFWLTHNRFSN